MGKKLALLAAALLSAGAVSAQSFSDTFDVPSLLPNWSFSGLTGVFNTPANPDDYLFVSTQVPVINPTARAQFTFNAVGAVPFYLVEFSYTGAGNVRFQAGALDETKTFGPNGVLTTNPGPNPGSGFFSWYFGSPILDTTPVTITLTGNGLGANVDNWSVAAVPEPSTYALMLAGLGVVGLMARRRQAAGGNALLAAA